ncbi:Protein CBG27718 [Caenorhabditis briggsae]|uniref:Protein CBG27718 n=1 Tax=Caenorhabditis briggsae TaxID=6238 RepID=B6IJ16_CAEBR|nr:Protein CBG27718 [Caenorhabditis briggsae]CAR99996.1 Protein CBG27718 [Caenorhabditis briggsae]
MKKYGDIAPLIKARERTKRRAELEQTERLSEYLYRCCRVLKELVDCFPNG